MTNTTTLSISDVCIRVASGGTPSRSNNEFYKGHIPWIKTQELVDGFVYDTQEHITEEAIRNSSAQLFPENTVLMAMYGATVGKLAILGNEMTCNQASCALVVNPEIADFRYLFYLLWANRERIIGLANGAAQQNLSAQTIKSLTFDFPSLKVQKETSEALGSLQDRIESINQAVETAQELLNALYRKWFIEYLPWGGTPPDSWKRGVLSDVLTRINESTTPGSEPKRPYVPIDSIPMKSLCLEKPRPNDEAKSSLFMFENNDILMGAMRVYFHRVVIAPFSGVTRNTSFVLRPKDKNYLEFALLTCFQESTIEHASATSRGTTMPYAVWNSGLADMPIIIPPAEVALDFSRKVGPLVEFVRDSYFETSKLRDTFSVLLPEMISGRISVSTEPRHTFG